jgi:hypothetical protein
VSVEEWRAAVNVLLLTDGYVVGWNDEPLRMGQRMPDISGSGPDQPFYVIGGATAEDAARQYNVLCQLLGPTRVAIPPTQADAGYFYKLQTD